MRKSPLARPLLWHSWLLAAICGLLAAIWPLQATIALLLLLLMEHRLWRPLSLLWLGLAFSAGLIYAHYQFTAAEAHRQHAPAWINTKTRFCATVKTSQNLTDGRLRLLLSGVHKPDETPLPGLCIWTWEHPIAMPLPGQTICLTRPLKPAQGFGNEHADFWQTNLLAQDIAWRVWSEKSAGDPLISGEPDTGAALRENLRSDFITLLSGTKTGPMPQSRAILAALLFGDRGYLTGETTRLFAAATLAHSLALSGQHLALAGLIGALLILGAARLKPGLYLLMPKAVLILLLAIPLGFAYLWLGNSPASLRRAFAMLAFAAIWLARKKPFSGLDLLCGALAAILIINPLAIFDTGLQMSALCIAIIFLAAPAIASLLPQNQHSPPG